MGSLMNLGLGTGSSVAFIMCAFVITVVNIRGVWSRSLVAGVQGDETSSSSAGSLYVVSLPFGTPPQSQVLLTLDLARAHSTIACTTSDAQSFHPDSSSTFRKIGRRTRSKSTSNCTYRARDYLSLTQRTVYSLNIPQTPLLSNSTAVLVPNVAFQCSLCSSPTSSSGIAAFGNHGSSALPAQLAKHAGLALEFAYCLPSYVIFGSRPEGYVFQNFPDPPMNYTMGGTLPRTPLTFDNNGNGYAVSLVDITVGGEDLKLEKPVKLYISTTDRYTKLESSVYSAVQASFRRHIGYGNVSGGGAAPVEAVSPFGTCFNATTLSTTDFRTTNVFVAAQRGQIVLILSGGLSWSFYTDALVSLPGQPEVLCWGVLDAGLNQPSVLGTNQQEGRLVHLDLANSSLGMVRVENLDFSIPALFRYRTCENFV